MIMVEEFLLTSDTNDHCLVKLTYLVSIMILASQNQALTLYIPIRFLLQLKAIKIGLSIIYLKRLQIVCSQL